MTDFVTQCATASDVTTWFAGIPSSVTSGDRYIAELAKGTYTIASSLTGKTVAVAGSIILRPATGSNQHTPNTNVAGPQTSSTAVIINTSFGGTITFGSSLADGFYVEDVQIVQNSNGTINFNSGTWVRRCFTSVGGGTPTISFNGTSRATNCIHVGNITGRAGVTIQSNNVEFNGNTYLNFFDVAAFATAGTSANVVMKNSVALNLAASPTVDPWPTFGTSFWSGGSNNATSNSSAGNMPGTSPLTSVSPSAALTVVSSYSALNARPKAGSALLGAGVAPAGTGVDWFLDTRSASTPTIGAVEFTTSPVTGPVFTGTITLDDVSLSGSFATGASTITGAVALDSVGLSGSFAPLPGTITSEPIESNNGTIHANKALNFVDVYNDTTGAFVLRKTGLSTDSNGVFTFSDSLLVAGVNYAFNPQFATGEHCMPRKAAT